MVDAMNPKPCFLLAEAAAERNLMIEFLDPSETGVRKAA
jgi:hypothetical protein